MSSDTDNGLIDVGVECEVDIERLSQLRSVWKLRKMYNCKFYYERLCNATGLTRTKAVAYSGRVVRHDCTLLVVK
jgi:hypothetical protein